MSAEIVGDEWLRDNLIDQEDWHPEKLGYKKTIFSTPIRMPLICNCFDSSSPKGEVKWKKIEGKNAIESFFDLLSPAVDSRFELLYYNHPFRNWIVLATRKLCDLTEWSSKLLHCFEIFGIHGGFSYLVLVLSAGKGIIVFETGYNFEINYYGDQDLWTEISDRLEIYF